MNDSASPNYNKFAPLMNPVSHNQCKWVVPPKSEHELEEERRAREEVIKVGQQMKRDRLAKNRLLHKLTQELPQEPLQELPQEMLQDLLQKLPQELLQELPQEMPKELL